MMGDAFKTAGMERGRVRNSFFKIKKPGLAMMQDPVLKRLGRTLMECF
jgi:hypothetical protein